MKQTPSAGVSVAGISRLVAASLVGAIAVAYFAIALADGGSSLLLIAFMTAVVWWTVIVGLVLGILPRARVPARAIFAAVSLGGLGLFAALSMIWANDDGGAFTDVLRITEYVGILLLVVLASPRGSARIWLSGLAIGIAGLAAWALASRYLPGLPGGDENIATFLPDAGGRLSYPIGYWNALGACMALGVVLLTWLGSHALWRPGRALAVGAIPLCGLALYMTASAGAALAVAIGAAVLVLLSSERPRLIANLALGGIGSAILIVLDQGPQRPRRRRSGLDAREPGPRDAGGHDRRIRRGRAGALCRRRPARAAQGQPRARDRRHRRARARRRQRRRSWSTPCTRSTCSASRRRSSWRARTPPSDISRLDSSGRCQYWEAAIDGFKSDPAIGVGAGGFEALWNRNATFTRQIRHAHSLFFENLAELGLPGLLLVLGFLAPAVMTVWRRPGLVPLAGGEFGVAAGSWPPGSPPRRSTGRGSSRPRTCRW